MRLNNFCYTLVIFFSACTANSNQTPQEDIKTGNIKICVDESYEPVFEELLKVFRASSPNNHIQAYYKPEAECLKMLTNDSFRIVFLARSITQTESDIIENKINFKPRYGVLAYDAVALVVNAKSSDSILNFDEIKNILNAQNKKYTPLVDGLVQSSITRYLSQDFMKDDAIIKNLKGSKNSKELLKKVATQNNVLGFIGISWVGNKEDSMQLSFSKQLKIIALPCKNCEQENKYVKPYLANIAYNKYPFIREITYVLKENFSGAGRGFVNFLSNERGQLIFKRAYLMPAKINFNVRNVKLK